MATLTNITDDMVRNAMDELEGIGQKHSAWLGDHIDEIVEIIKKTPEGDAARRDFLAFCKTSPFDGELWKACRLVDIMRLAGCDMEMGD